MLPIRPRPQSRPEPPPPPAPPPPRRIRMPIGSRRTAPPGPPPPAPERPPPRWPPSAPTAWPPSRPASPPWKPTSPSSRPNTWSFGTSSASNPTGWRRTRLPRTPTKRSEHRPPVVLGVGPGTVGSGRRPARWTGRPAGRLLRDHAGTEEAGPARITRAAPTPHRAAGDAGTLVRHVDLRAGAPRLRPLLP